MSTDSEPITVTISPNATRIFSEFDIVVSNQDPFKGFRKTWSIVYHVQETDVGETVSLRRLNVSRFAIIRRIELWVLRKLLTKKQKDNE